MYVLNRGWQESRARMGGVSVGKGFQHGQMGVFFLTCPSSRSNWEVKTYCNTHTHKKHPPKTETTTQSQSSFCKSIRSIPSDIASAWSPKGQPRGCTLGSRNPLAAACRGVPRSAFGQLRVAPASKSQLAITTSLRVTRALLLVAKGRY